MTRFRIIGGLIAIGVLILFALFLSGTISSLFTAKQQVRVSKGQAGASIDSGAEASKTIGELMRSDDATRRTVEEGINAIRNAPEADRAAIAERTVCGLRVYVNSERCARLREAGPAGAGNSS